MMIGSQAEGQLINIAFRSQRVGIMRGEGWRLARGSSRNVGGSKDTVRFFWKREPGQAITCGSGSLRLHEQRLPV